jgi:hypothetical protein
VAGLYAVGQSFLLHANNNNRMYPLISLFFEYERVCGEGEPHESRGSA